MYTRAQPSPRYRSLLQMYAELHRHGHGGNSTAAETFEGISLIPHVHTVRRLVAETGAQNLLDYGAGKGSLYGLRNVLLPGERTPIESVQDYWDVDYVELYDPGYAPYSKLPGGRYDGVVCTDVMEHCPEEDLPWILGEIFSYANRFVFLTIARYPALKHLPNGENAHITIKPAEWWSALIGEAARSQPGVLWEARVEELALADPVRLIREGVTLRGGRAP
jgi:hypothetical protein